MSQNVSSGLSTGAIAGIAVAAVLVGLGIIGGLAFIFIRRRQRAAAEADAAAVANMPGYFENGYYASGPGHVRGMSEIYTARKDPKTAMRVNYSPTSLEAIHEPDSRPVPAQLYGSETHRGVTEMP
jgi:hypothetical protein